MNIAYQVFGDGPEHLVCVPGAISNVDLAWELDATAAYLTRLGAHFRVIMFDKRGQGLSDRFDGIPSLEASVDDVRAVMHAAGCQRATGFVMLLNVAQIGGGNIVRVHSLGACHLRPCAKRPGTQLAIVVRPE